MFRAWTARFRHSEAISFFFLNVLLQFVPIAVSFSKKIVGLQEVDQSDLREAMWIMFAFALWNAPNSIRSHILDQNRKQIVQLVLYSVSSLVTFVTFWMIFSAPDKVSVSDRTTEYFHLPLLPVILLILLSIII